MAEGIFTFDKDAIEKSHDESKNLPDAHYESPKLKMSINWAGLTRIRKWFKVKMGSETGVLMIHLQALVDLPQTMRGFNISRHSEVIDEIAYESSNSPKGFTIQSLVEAMAARLLLKHEYSSKSYVKAECFYPYLHKTPKNIPTQQTCLVMMSAWAERLPDNSTKTKRRALRVSVETALACPLAQQMLEHRFERRLNELGMPSETIERVVKIAPVGTHMERSISSIEIGTSIPFEFSIEDFVTIIEKAASAPLYELLKRPDELAIVESMLTNTRFAEDTIRKMAKDSLETFEKLPDNAVLKLRTETMFTLSAYNVVAKKNSTIGEIRKELSKS